MLNFQTNTSALKSQQPLEYAKNLPEMKKEWEHANALMGEIQKLAKALVLGKAATQEQVADVLGQMKSKMDELKAYSDASKFLNLGRETSLMYCLQNMAKCQNAIARTNDPGTAVQNIALLDSHTTYYMLKIGAYQKLAGVMELIDAEKLDSALATFQKGSNTDVFLGSFSTNQIKNAVGAKDAGKAADACQKMFEALERTPVWAPVELKGVEITAIDPFHDESTWGKALSWVPVAGSIRDIARGIKHMNRGTDSWYTDKEGWMVLGIGMVGLGLDVVSIFTFGATSVVKTAGRKVMMAEMGNMLKGTARLQATKELAKVFTTAELREITTKNLSRDGLTEVFEQLGQAETRGVERIILKDGAVNMIPDTEIAGKIVQKLKAGMVEAVYAKTGGKLSRDEIANVVEDSYGTMFERVQAKIERELTERSGSPIMGAADQGAVRGIILREYKDVSKATSKGFAKKLSALAIE
ncbi:MAG: hypothetical protein WC263_01775, partial [Candidatus Micrarchaeia archaeon]